MKIVCTKHPGNNCVVNHTVTEKKRNNPITAKYAQIARELGLGHLIPESAHSRLQETNFLGTTRQWNRIEAEYIKIFGDSTRHELPLKTVFSINTTTGRGQNLSTNSKQHHIKGRTVMPSKLHVKIQKWFENTFGAISEPGRIDSLIRKVALEIKPKWSAGEFDNAVGKSHRTAFRYGYKVGIVGLSPLGNEELQQLKEDNISYICLNWTAKKIDIKNSWMTNAVKNALT
jgi:hypothetical protein